MRAIRALAAAWLTIGLMATSTSAQLPTDVGRTFTLSNTAWKVHIPDQYFQRAGNVADVMVHFHGDPQTYWNNAKYANLNAIQVTVNYSGLSSAYTTPFSNAALFQQVIDEALTKVRQQADIPDNLQWDKLAVTSFSAGYGAVREILKSATYRNDIDALLAADSLYASTAGDGTPLDSLMADYKTFANLAKNGSKTFLYSHSQVPTYTYENTGECGDELMQSLGITAAPYNVNGLGTLTFYRHAKAGNFELWGATGTDGAAHSKHLQYIGEFMEELPLAKVVPGDYDNSGRVDNGDYIYWRNNKGTAAKLPNDGNVSPGVIDNADYNFWRSRFGATVSLPPGAGAGSTLEGAAAVPEPAACTMLLVAFVLSCAARAKSRRFPS